MEETDWDAYGTGNYEKCADCMVHSGFEATAVTDTVRQAVEGARGGVARREDRGPMAPDIPLEGQRPAEYVFSAAMSRKKLAEIRAAEAEKKSGKAATAA